jgi:hypothetical protein
MGAFSFRKFKKKPRLHKRDPLAAKPAGYRLPWSDKHSPLRIRFEDRDEHCQGMKFARLLSEDGSTHPMILPEELWRAMTGDAPQGVVDAALIDYPELSPDDIRQQIQAALEARHKCSVMVPQPPPLAPHHDCTVEMIMTSWTGMLYLDLYARVNKVPIWLDAEADLVISGYELFERGVMDENCMFNMEPMQPTPEQRQEFADIFDLIDSGNAMKEANKRAHRKLMFVYHSYLTACV